KAISDLERKRLSTVLELLPVGVFISDGQGEILHKNSMASRIWGEDAPLLKEMADYRQYQGWWADTGRPIASHEWALARALTNGESLIEEEIEIQAFDGSRKTILNSAVPIRDETGAIASGVVVNVDITQRKQAEEALRRLAKRLEALHEIDRAILRAESATELATTALARLHDVVPFEQAAIALFNFETNEAELLAGRFDSKVVGSTVSLSELMPFEVSLQQESIYYIKNLALLDWRSPALERQLAEGQRSFLSVALIVEGKPIGQLVLFSRQVAAFTSEHQEIAAEVANQLAVAIQQARLQTQLQRHAAELEQRVAERTAALQDANESLEVFVYSISHDLRAPLRGIQGFAQALLEDYAEGLGAEGQNYAHYLADSAQEMSNLIQDLLDYSRLSRADMTLQIVNLDALVARVLTQLNAEIQEKHAQIIVEQPLPEAIAHWATLVQVIANLVTNAIKFVPSGIQPQVRIWAEEPEQTEYLRCTDREQQDAQSKLQHPTSKIRLWVEDNGIGIDSKHQEKIFQVFERLHGAEVYPGTGIGLAIARKGVERMGGRVGVESQLGQGSRFWVELQQAPSVSSE
ncbi:MAG TPA: ATP-binding protein, partial [Allocoleopsis sp.]